MYSQVLRTNSKHASYLSVFFSLPPSRPDPISPAAQSTPRQTVRSFSAEGDTRYPKNQKPLANTPHSIHPPRASAIRRALNRAWGRGTPNLPFSRFRKVAVASGRGGLVTAAEATLCSELASVLQKPALVPAMGLRVDRQR